MSLTQEEDTVLSAVIAHHPNKFTTTEPSIRNVLKSLAHKKVVSISSTPNMVLVGATLTREGASMALSKYK